MFAFLFHSHEHMLTEEWQLSLCYVVVAHLLVSVAGGVAVGAAQRWVITPASAPVIMFVPYMRDYFFTEALMESDHTRCHLYLSFQKLYADTVGFNEREEA